MKQYQYVGWQWQIDDVLFSDQQVFVYTSWDSTEPEPSGSCVDTTCSSGSPPSCGGGQQVCVERQECPRDYRLGLPRTPGSLRGGPIRWLRVLERHRLGTSSLRATPRFMQDVVKCNQYGSVGQFVCIYAVHVARSN